MIRMVRTILASALALAATTTIAPAADPVYVPVRIDADNICAHGHVLGKITSRFRHQVRNVPNLPIVDIVGYRQVVETRYQPKSPDWPIERRYCHAQADLSNGYTRDVWYLIERPMGFAGFGSNVEFCVSGFDRWHVYGGRCRVLR